jgi:predicted Zn-dependent protease with MMP-like domain
MRPFSTPPSTEELAALADRALDWMATRFPAPLRPHLSGLHIIVEDLPDDETLAELGLDSPYELTGLYRGTSMLHASVSDPGDTPPLVVLYREPILLEWIEDGHDLSRLVRNVLVHEIAHHFGFSDAEIAALEAEG